MESFLIDWRIDDIEVQCLMGADYVRDKTSKLAKQTLLDHLQAKCPQATIKIGRASRRTAPDDDLYIS